MRAKTTKYRRSEVERGVARSTKRSEVDVRDIRPGNEGNEVEVESKWYKVSRRWGERSMILLFVKWECYVNISKNNSEEVEMGQKDGYY